MIHKNTTIITLFVILCIIILICFFIKLLIHQIPKKSNFQQRYHNLTLLDRGQRVNQRPNYLRLSHDILRAPQVDIEDLLLVQQMRDRIEAPVEEDETQIAPQEINAIYFEEIYLPQFFVREEPPRVFRNNAFDRDLELAIQRSLQDVDNPEKKN